MKKELSRIRLKWAGLLLTALVILILDYVTKVYVHTHIPYLGFSSPLYPYGGIGVFEGFLGGIDFSINQVINTGAAWGIFSNMKTPLLYFRIVLAVSLIGYVLFYNRVSMRAIPLVMIISGAVGNIIDNFHYGYVIDFLLFKFWGYAYPLFNVADIAICLGVSLLLLQTLFLKKKGPASEETNAH